MTFKPDIFFPETLELKSMEERINDIKARIEVLSQHSKDVDTIKTIESLEKILLPLELAQQVTE